MWTPHLLETQGNNKHVQAPESVQRKGTPHGAYQHKELHELQGSRGHLCAKLAAHR